MLNTADSITLHRVEAGRALDCADHFAGCEAEEPLLGLDWLKSFMDRYGFDVLDADEVGDPEEWLRYAASDDVAIDGPRALDEAALPAMLAHLSARTVASEVLDAA